MINIGTEDCGVDSEQEVEDRSLLDKDCELERK